MAKNHKQGAQIESGLQSIEGSLSKTEHFLERYKKPLSITAIVILVGVAIIFAYKKFYIQPLKEEAQEQIFVAQQYFERDSFNLALNGDGDYPGFLQIIDDYGSTEAGNLANYYAGVSYYKLGEYENAIDYLNEFSTDDKLLSSVAFGCIGDSYVELNNLEKATEFYKKAADVYDNKLTTPIYLMKLGRIYEETKKWKEALDVYQRVKIDFKTSQEGRTVDKFITRVKYNMQ
jgi:tetratricopeptide (TPR) repeat protein